MVMYSTMVFSQAKFGVAVQCIGQGDFCSEAKSGSTVGVSGLGVLHIGIVDLSLGIGYSYKCCSKELHVVYDAWHNEMIYQLNYQMHFLNVPFGVSVQCWKHDKFRLKVFNELEYNRLFHHVSYLKDMPQTAIIDRWGDIPQLAKNGLTYRLGLLASYSITDHCILNITPFFGVKAVLNQYESTPTHFPSEQHGYLPDHRFSSGVIIGMEYCF